MRGEKKEERKNKKILSTHSTPSTHSFSLSLIPQNIIMPSPKTRQARLDRHAYLDRLPRHNELSYLRLFLLRFHLSLPPTDNLIRKPVTRSSYSRSAVMVLSKEYREWKEKTEEQWEWYVEEVKRQLTQSEQFLSPTQKDFFKLLPIQQGLDCQLEFFYWLHKPDDRSDDSNYQKALQDFMTNKLYDDDRHISLHRVMPTMIDRENPRIEFCIVPVIYSWQEEK